MNAKFDPPSQKRLEKPKKRGPEENPWALASGGTQLLTTLLVGFFGGYYLDRAKGSFPWFTLIGATLGIIVGLYSFLKRFLK